MAAAAAAASTTASATAPKYPSVLRPVPSAGPGINKLAFTLAGTSTGLLLYVVASPKRYPPHYVERQFLNADEWIQRGVGNYEYYCPEKGAVFPPYKWLDALPPLEDHNNHTADIFRENPGLYDELKKRATENGINLGKCIKTGMDNSSLHMDKQVGAVAADVESYWTFKELFDEVLRRLHGYDEGRRQPHDFDSNKLTDVRIDPLEKYVRSCTLRLVRSLDGFALSPSITFDERRELENVITKTLAKLEGSSKGTYYPLPGSQSYTDATLSRGEETRLKDEGILLPEPASTIILSSGIGRHWPDGRGVFFNDKKDVFVWVNNSDHLEISVRAAGDDIKGNFEKLMLTTGNLERALREDDCSFAHDEHLGYLSTCPGNLGTGLRLAVEVRLPNLVDRSDFRKILEKLGLHMIVTEENSSEFVIEKIERMGRSEVQITNDFMRSCTKLVKLECRLEEGLDVDEEVKAMLTDR